MTNIHDFDFKRPCALSSVRIINPTPELEAIADTVSQIYSGARADEMALPKNLGTGAGDSNRVAHALLHDLFAFEIEYIHAERDQHGFHVFVLLDGWAVLDCSNAHHAAPVYATLADYKLWTGVRDLTRYTSKQYAQACVTRRLLGTQACAELAQVGREHLAVLKRGGGRTVKFSAAFAGIAI